jgi:hypothetical protein
MKNSKKWMQIVLAIMIACIGAQISCKPANKPSATAAATFNRRFIPTIKPEMTYEQIAKIAGAPGIMISENKNASPPTIQYRWNGGKDSILTVQFGNNRMIDATVLAPNGHTYLIPNKGDPSDITK